MLVVKCYQIFSSSHKLLEFVIISAAFITGLIFQQKFVSDEAWCQLSGETQIEA